MKNYGIHDDEVRKKFPAKIKKSRQRGLFIIYIVYLPSLCAVGR